MTKYIYDGVDEVDLKEFVVTHVIDNERAEHIFYVGQRVLIEGADSLEETYACFFADDGRLAFYETIGLRLATLTDENGEEYTVMPTSLEGILYDVIEIQGVE